MNGEAHRLSTIGHSICFDINTCWSKPIHVNMRQACHTNYKYCAQYLKDLHTTQSDPQWSRGGILNLQALTTAFRFRSVISVLSCSHFDIQDARSFPSIEHHPMWNWLFTKLICEIIWLQTSKWDSPKEGIRRMAGFRNGTVNGSVDSDRHRRPALASWRYVPGGSVVSKDYDCDLVSVRSSVQHMAKNLLV